MSHIDHRQFEGALERIDIAILPSLSRLLDDVIESAALARPGDDAEDYAASLRKTARQVEQLTRLIAMVAPHQRSRGGSDCIGQPH
jgi:vacuolar-type H+-ATPase subunit B/Vma2